MSLRQQIPNFLTTLNLISGVVGVYLLLYGHHKWVLCCIGISLLADFLDGWAARKLGVAGPLGVQLDSLADMLTFGVLPGMMVTKMIAGYENNLPHWIYIMTGMTITVGAMIRLAKFNIDEDQRTGFLGLPTPAMSIYITGIFIPFALEDPTIEMIYGSYPWLPAWIIQSILLVILMNARIPMPSLKDLSSHRTFAISLGILMVGATILCFLFNPIALLWVLSALYICSAVIYSQILKK